MAHDIEPQSQPDYGLFEGVCDLWLYDNKHADPDNPLVDAEWEHDAITRAVSRMKPETRQAFRQLYKDADLSVESTRAYMIESIRNMHEDN